MPDKALKSLAKRAGISSKEAEKKWKLAKKEAESLGQKDNYAYVMEIFKSMIGLDESFIDNTISDLNSRFLKSSYNNLSTFLEDTYNGKLEETVISSGFFGLTPSENPIGIVKLGNPDKQKLKIDINDHVGEHSIGSMGELEVEKNAKALGFDIIKKKNTDDNDLRSPEHTDEVLDDLDSAEPVDIEKDVDKVKDIKETITSTNLGDTPENALKVKKDTKPKVLSSDELKKKIKDEEENKDEVEVLK